MIASSRSVLFVGALALGASETDLCELATVLEARDSAITSLQCEFRTWLLAEDGTESEFKSGVFLRHGYRLRLEENQLLNRTSTLTTWDGDELRVFSGPLPVNGPVTHNFVEQGPDLGSEFQFGTMPTWFGTSLLGHPVQDSLCGEEFRGEVVGREIVSSRDCAKVLVSTLGEDPIPVKLVWIDDRTSLLALRVSTLRPARDDSEAALENTVSLGEDSFVVLSTWEVTAMDREGPIWLPTEGQLRAFIRPGHPPHVVRCEFDQRVLSEPPDAALFSPPISKGMHVRDRTTGKMHLQDRATHEGVSGAMLRRCYESLISTLDSREAVLEPELLPGEDIWIDRSCGFSALSLYLAAHGILPEHERLLGMVTAQPGVDSNLAELQTAAAHLGLDTVAYRLDPSDLPQGTALLMHLESREGTGHFVAATSSEREIRLFDPLIETNPKVYSRADFVGEFGREARVLVAKELGTGTESPTKGPLRVLALGALAGVVILSFRGRGRAQ